MKILKFLLLMTLFCLPSFAADRAQLDDGNGNIMGTSANPVHVNCVSGCSGGGGSGSPAGTSGSLQYNSSGTQAGANVYQSSSGNVGIGSTNPGYALDVNGTIRATNFSSTNLATDQVFNVKNYSAKGDGIQYTDGTVAAGSTAFSSSQAKFTSADIGKVINIFQAGTLSNTVTNSNGDGTCSTGAPTAFTSASGTFAKTDYGKYISIPGAGTAGGTLITTIAAWVSATAVTLTTGCSTSVTTATYSYSNINDLDTTISAFVDSHDVTLANSATTAVSGSLYVYGTDDTTAIQSAINALTTNGGGTLYSPVGLYIINGNFGTNPSSQIYLPNILITNNAVPIKILGSVPTVLGDTANASIWMFTKNGNSGQSGLSVYGTGTINGAHFSNVDTDIEDMIFKTVGNLQSTAVDMSQSVSFSFNALTIQNYALGGAVANTTIAPSGSGSYGLKTPLIQNYANIQGERLQINGYYTALLAGEHLSVFGFNTSADIYGVEKSDSIHSAMFYGSDIEGVTYPITCDASAKFDFAYLEIEHHSNASWEGTIDDVYDPSNHCNGTIKYLNTNDSGASGVSTTSLTVNGAAYVTSYNILTNQTLIGAPYQSIVNNGGGFIGNVNFSNGNIGIGTTNPVSNSTSEMLYLQGTDAYAQIGNASSNGSGSVISGGSGGISMISDNVYVNAASTHYQALNSSLKSAAIIQNQNTIGLYTMSAATQPTPTEQVSIGTTGVAIGSTYSANAGNTNGLIVQGNVSIDTTSASVPLAVGTTGQFQVNSSGNVSIGSSTPGGMLDVEGTVSPIILNGKGNSAVNVGIGSFSPGSQLDVQGTVRGISGGTCTTLYRCQGGTDAGIIQTSACVLCPASTCVAMNGCF
jgi:hypothetical protein